MPTFILARNSEFGNSGTCTAGVRECELPSPFATTIEQTGPRLDVLLIDELGYLNPKPEQSNIFFKLMEERYRQHSTIVTTNLVMTSGRISWAAGPMVEALLSRLRHYCHTVHIDGPSLRVPQG